MSDKMRAVLYETHVKIIVGTSLVHETDYINTQYVYRVPLVKAASFTLMTLSLSPKEYKTIFGALLKSQAVHTRVKYNLSNAKERRGKHGFEKLPAGRHTIYSVLKIIPRINLTTQTKVIPVTLVMTHFMLNELNSNNDFNQLFLNKYSIDVMEEYKSFVESQPLESNVKWYSIGDTESGSRAEKYFYEQIVLKAQSDMYIGHNIINVYPFLDEFQYFFYDDFNATIHSIVGIHANLTDPDNFNTIEIYNESEYFEIARSLRFKSTQEIKNYKLADEKPANINMTDNDLITYYHKEEEPIVRYWSDQSSTKNPVHKGRTTYHKLHEEPIIKEKSNKKVEQIYTPNLFDSSLKKHYKIKEFIKSVAESLYIYEIDQVHMEAIQLNKAYLLDKTDPGAKFLPVGIVNIFERVNPHQLEVSHRVRMICLKYP